MHIAFLKTSDCYYYSPICDKLNKLNYKLEVFVRGTQNELETHSLLRSLLHAGNPFQENTSPSLAHTKAERRTMVPL